MKLNKIFDVKNKVILITGACGLIGSNIARTFIDNGSIVIYLDKDISKKDKIIPDKEPIQSDAKKNAYFYELDISDEDESKKIIDKIYRKFKKIDVLINCAAIDAKFEKSSVNKIKSRNFEDFPSSLIEESIKINQIGLINFTKAVCKVMLKNKNGNIINVASTYSLVSPNQNLYNFGADGHFHKPVDYVASKSFLPNFSRYIATLYAKSGIRCNTIVPHGVVENPSKSFEKNWKKISPIGRLCNVEELNGPFIFLASDASSYVTGATIVVDGGWTAW